VARSLWTGSVSFGLVNIPVRLFPAIREHDVHFHQLAPDGSRIHYKRVSDKTGREVDYDKIRKGYETSRGKYVVFEQEELKELRPRSTKTIDIEDFVPLDDIDPIYFERTYHLVPNGEGAAKAYALLAGAMEDRERVGIGKVVMRDKQYLAAIRPYGKGLALSTMLFGDEVVPQADVEGLPGRKPNVGTQEKKLATQIVDALERDWDPKRYHDTYQEQLRDIIKAKEKGKTVELEEEPEEEAKVVDLMAALEASLDRRRGGARSGRRRTASNRSTTRSKKRTTKRATKRAPRTRKRTAARRSA
jgi:DNA end-binding protein Ku